MNETTKKSGGEVITVWEIAEFLQDHNHAFDATYKMHNATIRRHFLNGELVNAKEQTVLLFLDVAKFMGRQVESMKEVKLFCGKIVTAIVRDRLPAETINKIVDEMEHLLKE